MFASSGAIDTAHYSAICSVKIHNTLMLNVGRVLLGHTSQMMKSDVKTSSQGTVYVIVIANP